MRSMEAGEVRSGSGLQNKSERAEGVGPRLLHFCRRALPSGPSAGNLKRGSTCADKSTNSQSARSPLALSPLRHRVGLRCAIDFSPSLESQSLGCHPLTLPNHRHPFPAKPVMERFVVEPLIHSADRGRARISGEKSRAVPDAGQEWRER